MKKTHSFTGLLFLIASLASLLSCQKNGENTDPYQAIKAQFGTKIDPANLANYANQTKPPYILKDNTGGNTITNAKATVGRVLFYDKQLSINNTIACGSCHIQKFAFGDTAVASLGVLNGRTGRHSMRLINARFSNEEKFFWDERAATLENQTTRPIQDHAEMGFSGQNGRPGLSDLLTKLKGIGYYQELFKFAYGDQNITEPRLQECLAQFVRSIQSFDSKYDEGRAVTPQDQQPFPNYSAQENLGKNLFLTIPQFNTMGVRTGGGLGCAGCHAPPEFSIDPNSGNNGVIGNLGAPGIDINNTRSPSLRDIAGADGNPNGPLMHTGQFRGLQAVLGHYGQINLATANTRLDPRLRPNGVGQQLNLTQPEVDAVIAFMRTLTGRTVYTDARWSDPF
ncbi:MAG: cytochrome-c peroxidase [Chitinophagia bacterium]|nr:cytochrome-c peroxidase [Chitinophagia bacterium]